MPLAVKALLDIASKARKIATFDAQRAVVTVAFRVVREWRKSKVAGPFNELLDALPVRAGGGGR